MAEVKLTEKSKQVFDYVKGNGDHVAVAEMVEALDRNSRSINASVNDLVKKGLCVREKIAGDDDKEITYVNLTEDGAAFVPAED